jgi:aliphatic sulfonates family ABC transporter substrate-binding protein
MKNVEQGKEIGMKTSRTGIAAMVGAILLIAGSCGLAAAQSKSTTIRFAYQTSIAGGSLMVTEARGLWGVPVESKGFVAGSDVLQAILAGSADAGSMATTPTITGGQTGDFVIAAVANRVGDTTAIVVPPNSGIKSVADLKGKTLAIQEGTTTALDIRNYVLPHFGLTPSDVRLVNMNMGDMPAALGGGRVDAVASVEPYISIAVQQKIGVRIQSMMEFDPIPVFIVFRSDFVDKHKDVVINALRGYYTAVKWIKAHPKEAVDDIVAGLEKQGVHLDRSVVQMAWNTVDLDVQFSEADMRAYLNGAAQLLLKNKKLKHVPDWNKLIRLDLARAAMGN